MKRTLEQLRSQTWATREAAVKDLKRSGFAERGADYALGEFKPGSWQVLPLDDDGSAQEAVSAQPSLPARQAAVKKSASKGKPKTEIKPKSKPAVNGAPSMAEEPATPALFPAPEPAAPQDADEAKIDLTFLPLDQGPFTITLEVEQVRQNTVVTHALEISRALRLPVAIHGPSGAILRTVDAKAVAAAKRQHGSRGGKSGRKGPVKTSGKSAEVAALLLREQGATMAEMVAVTEWSFGERFVRRIAATHDATIEVLGDKHWRLVKPSA